MLFDIRVVYSSFRGTIVGSNAHGPGLITGQSNLLYIVPMVR